MSDRPTIARSARAALHRLNRNRRVVAALGLALHVGFRCLPPVLWDRMRWAQNLNARVSRASGCEATLRRIFGEVEVDYMPWRLSDLLGWTERRRTALGKLWHAEAMARQWAGRVTYVRERYQITDDAEATDGA